MTPPLWEIAARIAGLSLVAVGGVNALIPAVHRAVVGGGWIDEAAFGASVAVAQIAPGPNLMYLPLIGYQVAGPLGALVALAAFLLPTCSLAVVVARPLERLRDHRVIAALRRALRPTAAGLFFGAAVVLAQTYALGSPLDVGIAVAVAALALATRVSALTLLAAAAAAGAVLGAPR